ncbi:uncharacterized protein CDAR_285301 [Caerostris darwini]|uniref:Uncharacterized protein n=1 Tax=Caerostris darwini TaxID=1538125 RepID=A0AAV4SW75_9ARAC|nr:uncharacterized protein CDAR_285301 [Caerostris darwini]
MEDPWLDVNISEDNTVTQAASTKPYAIQSPTLKYPSEEIEVADGELWPNEKNNDFPEGSLQKYSIIILQNNCSGMKDVLGNVSKAASVNDTDLTNIIEDCQTFATVRVSAQKSTEEAIAEIRKIFYNFKVVKIIQDVGKREEISLDLSSNFSDAGEMKNYYYIIGGIAIAFLIMIIVNFAVCSRKKRNNQSLDLSEIPHLTLATENFTMSIPRPTITSSSR